MALESIEVSSGQGLGKAQVYDGTSAQSAFKKALSYGVAGAREKKAEQKEKKKEQNDALKSLIDMDLSFWELQDNEIIAEKRNKLVDYSLKQLTANPNWNPNTDKNWLEGYYDITTTAGMSDESKSIYKFKTEQLFKDADKIANAPDIAENLKEYAAKSPFERASHQFIDPVGVKVQAEFDPYKDLNPFIDNVGYKTFANLADGTKTKGLQKPDFQKAASTFITGKKDWVQKGVDKGLWADETEAKDFVLTNLILSDKSGVTDIVEYGDDTNFYGSGSKKEDVLNNFQQWQKDILAGDDEAAGYLVGQKTIDNGALSGFKKSAQAVPSTSGQGVQLGGILSPVSVAQPVYDFSISFPRISRIKDTDGRSVVESETPTDTVTVNFADMTEEQRFKYYLNTLKDRKQLYKGGVLNQTEVGNKKTDPLGIF